MTEKLKVDWWCVAPEDTCPIKNENDELIYYRQLSKALEEYNQISELKKKIKNLKVAVEVLTKYSQKLKKENEQLKSTIKEVTELLSDEVDLFSDKATEHDINAYVELKELDNKDAYYMATATKKAIKMLKECFE